MSLVRHFQEYEGHATARSPTRSGRDEGDQRVDHEVPGIVQPVDVDCWPGRVAIEHGLDERRWGEHPGRLIHPDQHRAQVGSAEDPRCCRTEAAKRQVWSNPNSSSSVSAKTLRVRSDNWFSVIVDAASSCRIVACLFSTGNTTHLEARSAPEGGPRLLTDNSIDG